MEHTSEERLNSFRFVARIGQCRGKMYNISIKDRLDAAFVMALYNVFHVQGSNPLIVRTARELERRLLAPTIRRSD